MENYKIWANSVGTQNSKMLAEGKLQNRRFHEYFVLWLTDLAENLLDDNSIGFILAFQRILKSAKKWPRFGRFSCKPVYPHSAVHNLVIFHDFRMSFETQSVKALNIFFTNRHFPKTDITGFISLQSCEVPKIAKNGYFRLFSAYYYL